MGDAVCVICDDPAGELMNVQTRAIQTLIASSKRRRDNKYKIFERMESLLAHKNCSKNYNREKSIQAAAKQLTQKLVDGKKAVIDAANFDFASLCFICDGVLNEPKHQIKLLKKVKQETTSSRLLKNGMFLINSIKVCQCGWIIVKT